MARVAIGIPVYNGENFLGQCLDSLLKQTFADFEIVISDNASSDGTRGICERYAAKDSRIHYYRNETNLGPGPNYNRVVHLSRGEYFKWAAHDDLHAPDYLEKCIRFLDHHPEVVLCHSKTCFIDGDGNKIGIYDDKLKTDSLYPHVRFRALIMNVKCFDIFGVIRLDTLRKTPLHGSFGHADGSLLTRLGLMGAFYEVPEYLFLNRDHPEKSIYKYSTFRDYSVFYDPKNEGKILFPRWRLGYEYVKSVFAVPMDMSERLRCFFQMVYWIRHCWKSLAANIVIASWLSIRKIITGVSPTARSNGEKLKANSVHRRAPDPKI